MNKLNIDIIVPNCGARFEFIVPEAMNIGEAIVLIAKTISEYGMGTDYDIESLYMFSKQDSLAMNKKYSFMEMGIKDGAEIILC